MIACVSLNPGVKEETINTISYASRARQIKKEIRANMMLKDNEKESTNQVRELQGELQELRQKLREREEMIEQMKKCLEQEKSSVEEEERSSPGRLMKKLKQSKSKARTGPIQLIFQKKTEESIDDIPTIKGGTYEDKFHFLESSFTASDACTTQMFQNKRHVMSETELREANLGICNQMLSTLAR